MSPRPTGEVVVLVLVCALSLVLILGTVGVVLVEIDNPSTDTTAASTMIGGVVTTLLGISVGYIVGVRSRSGP